jgi:hypothetical protein
MMVFVIGPLGELVTALPIGPESPGKTAGPSFEIFYRSGFMLPHTRGAWVLLHERILELEAFLERYAEDAGRDLGGAEVVRKARKALQVFAAKMAGQMDGLTERKVAPPLSWKPLS